MSFMKPQRFSDLSPTDIFYDTHRHGFDNKEQVWMKVTGNADFNVISDDGTRTGKMPEDKMVTVIRKKIHILDLRQGDQCCMVAHLGIGYMTCTVLKIEDKDGYRHITFIRPLIHASGFGTTCPSGYVHTEKFTAMVRCDDRKRDDYYHLVGVDTSAVYDEYKLVLSGGGCANRHRMAVYMQLMGDKRSIAEILCMDGLKINSECIGLLMNNFIKVREIPPEYPDRDDEAESRFIKELQAKADHTKWERKYLGMVEASRAKLV